MDYKKRFGLKEEPFRLSPDPDFFFPSETHRDALETLLYFIQSKEGFIQITGQPGTGKSMLLRKILKETGDSVVVGLILHSNIQAGDLIPILMQDLKIDTSRVSTPSRANLIPLFRDFLLAQARSGNPVVVIVDEAQNLPDETMEELRMLSNLETEKAKLLQIILVGQVELEERIRSDRLRQLSQRITVRYRLKPLNREETRSYIFHRLEIAALNRDENIVSFQAGVVGEIHKYSKGIPRLINIVSERCLMAAFIEGSTRITRRHLSKAILSIDGEPAKGTGIGRFFFRPTTWVLFVIFLLTAGLWGYLQVNPNLPLVSRVFSSITSVMTGSEPRRITSGEKQKSPEKDPVQATRMPPESEPAPEQPGLVAVMEPAPEKLEPAAVKLEPAPEKLEPAPEKLEPAAVKLEPAAVKLEPAAVIEAAAEQPKPAVVMEPAPEQPGTAANAISFSAQWMTLPQGKEQVGLINMAKGTLVMVKKKNGKFLRSSKIPVKWPYPQGIYMAGYSTRNKPFIFHPEITYLKKLELDDPEFWRLIRTGTKTITPLIALNSFDLLEKSPVLGADGVLQVVREWADTWRSMNSEKLMGYFSNVTSIYDIDMEQPLVFSKSRMETIKKDIMRQSSFITLNFSEPICFINPLDPNLAFAVFQQTYKSKIYQDRGTKVLYFRRLYNDSVNPDWKITGKLMVLDPDITIADPMPRKFSKEIH